LNVPLFQRFDKFRFGRQRRRGGSGSESTSRSECEFFEIPSAALATRGHGEREREREAVKEERRFLTELFSFLDRFSSVREPFVRTTHLSSPHLVTFFRSRTRFRSTHPNVERSSRRVRSLIIW
jgi:hypothetical protein